MSISIVIPARNEEEFLPKLLDSIVAQTVAPDEVIVVDSHSTDNTTTVAKSYSDKIPLRVVTAKEKGATPARNEGGDEAKSDYIMFVDSDIILAPNQIEKLSQVIEKRGLEVGGFAQRTHGGTVALRIGGRIMNGYVYLMSVTSWPIFFSCFFTSKRVFEKINGFDPAIFIMEDYDYALRAKRAGAKFGIVRGTNFYASARRFENEGSRKTVGNAIYAEFYRYTHGLRITKRLFDYGMGGESEPKGKMKD